MNDKSKKKVKDLVDNLSFLFGVNTFDKVFKWHSEDSDSLIASIIVEHDYQRLTINIYPMFWKEDVIAQRKAILHEMCHTVTMKQFNISARLLKGNLIPSNIINDESEEATSKIENILDIILTGHYKSTVKNYNKYK